MRSGDGWRDNKLGCFLMRTTASTSQFYWRMELRINICTGWEVGRGAVIDVSKDTHGTWEAACNVVQETV